MSGDPVLRQGLCHVLMAKMRGPRCTPDLLYLPGAVDPCGVVLRFPATKQVFVCFVSEPQSPQDLGNLGTLVPLPFPED